MWKVLLSIQFIRQSKIVLQRMNSKLHVKKNNKCGWFIIFTGNVNSQMHRCVKTNWTVPDFVLKVAKLPVAFLCYLNGSKQFYGHVLNEWHNLYRNAKSDGINCQHKSDVKSMTQFCIFKSSLNISIEIVFVDILAFKK